MDGVLHIFKNGYRKLHTTRSWDFIGLTQMSRRNLKMESDIIVGLLDTGNYLLKAHLCLIIYINNYFSFR